MYFCIVRKGIPRALSSDTRAAVSLVMPLDVSLAYEESQRNGSAQHDSRSLSDVASRFEQATFQVEILCSMATRDNGYGFRHLFKTEQCNFLIIS
jgi:hypothetical protein